MTVDSEKLTVTFGHHHCTVWQGSHRIGEVRRNPLTSTITIALHDVEPVYLGNDIPWSVDAVTQAVQQHQAA